jgi:hypothetical protein
MLCVSLSKFKDGRNIIDDENSSYQLQELIQMWKTDLNGEKLSSFGCLEESRIADEERNFPWLYSP